MLRYCSVGEAAMRWLIVALLGCMLIAPSAAAASEVYRWRDSNGVVHYGDRKPADAESERVELRDSKGLDGFVAAPVATPAPGSAPPAFVAPDILMYDHPNCGYCRQAERWFNSRGLRFRRIDITASKRNHDQFLRDGGRGTPLIFVDGVAVRGFNEQRLQRLVFGQ
jgi:glutaredoxin